MRALGVSVTAVSVGLVVYLAAVVAFAAIGIRVSPTFPEWMTIFAVAGGIDLVHRVFDDE